ncbi:MAG TPA: hypothetical protein EYG92_00850 [Lutibacter sp.]|nr:hypothetical protein [Lutibacter sp.]
MSIITLTSDFGSKDFSVSAVKGSLYDLIKNPTIVDISHEITPYNILETAFILKASYPNFPNESIHLIGIDSEYSIEHKHIVAKLNNHYFIAADNGIFSLLADENEYDIIVEIQHPKSKESSFPMRDVFVDIAAQIIFNEKLENLGSPINTINQWVKNIPNIAVDDEIIGHIVYIDNYGNIITDISKGLFNDSRKDRKFEIIASSAKINKIYTNYNSFINYNLEVNQRQQAGKALALFNSLDLLEIALYKSNPNYGGSASSLLGLEVGDSIKIVFE